MKENERQFQGNQISRIPKVAGIYAWYYKPLVVVQDSLHEVLKTFVEDSSNIHTEIKMRYGKRFVSDTSLDAVYGTKKESFDDILSESLLCAGNFLEEFFRSSSVQLFTRPIYIGIAKSLHERVYSQHYLSMSDMWDDDSSVSKRLNIFPNSTPQEVIEALGLPHSFALEARVRGISPRDLMVHIFPTQSLSLDELGLDLDDSNDDPSARRALERLLQLVSDPICGRQ